MKKKFINYLQEKYNLVDKNLFKNIFQRRSSKVIFSSPFTNTERGKVENIILQNEF